MHTHKITFPAERREGHKGQTTCKIHEENKVCDCGR